MKAPQTLRDLIETQLNLLYGIECHLIDVFPDIIKRSGDPALIRLLKMNLSQMEQHARRIEISANLVGIDLSRTYCPVVVDLITECMDLIEARSEYPHLVDHLINEGMQEIKSYKIAEYGTCFVMAENLGEDEVGQLLKQSIYEESLTSKHLSLINESTLEREQEGSRSNI